jgi:UDPglucose--hexose-1-phosphate uridylyltransferase
MAQERYRYWQSHEMSQYPMLIYNNGRQAGESINHPHAQIMASKIVPVNIEKELHGSKKYFDVIHHCVFCDLIEQEKSHKVRIVEENDNFIAFTFYAARFPFEMWILPKKHSVHYIDQSTGELGNLSAIMQKVIARLGKTLKNPSTNFYIHDLPPSHGDVEHFHWHLEITPRITNYGGYELGSGIIIDVMSPEEAAEFLKDAPA